MHKIGSLELEKTERAIDNFKLSADRKLKKNKRLNEFIMGKTVRRIAEEEGVTIATVKNSILVRLENKQAAGPGWMKFHLETVLQVLKRTDPAKAIYDR